MKFSIVTPSYNSERFIGETIESVISQKGDFEIEYIIVDGASNDGTLDIIKRYADFVKGVKYVCRCNAVNIKWVSEKDNGMYDAINKGFSTATGDIYAWINADDIYLPGAFEAIAKVFSAFPEIKWLKGITSYMNESSTIFRTGNCFLYNQRWISEGVYGRDAYFIQQDSVFWLAELWKKVGGIDRALKLAGDYYLWRKFAGITPLFTVKAYLSAFRRAKGQLSDDMASYMEECSKLPAPEGFRSWKIKRFFSIEKRVPAPLRPFLYRLLFGRQDLNLIELVNGKEPVLKKVSYYIG